MSHGEKRSQPFVTSPMKPCRSLTLNSPIIAGSEVGRAALLDSDGREDKNKEAACGWDSEEGGRPHWFCLGFPARFHRDLEAKAITPLFHSGPSCSNQKQLFAISLGVDGWIGWEPSV